MNVLVAIDGSKYGRWSLNWVAKLPFSDPPRVLALHVCDHATLRAPFMAQPVMPGNEQYIREEIQRMEVRSAKILKEATQQLAKLNLTGAARKEQGAVAPTILSRAPNQNGLLVVGSRSRDDFDRFMFGSVSTKLIHHATCPVFVVKCEAAPLRRITLATDGSAASTKALAFILSTFRPDSFSGKGRGVPIHVSVVHVVPSAQYAGLKKAGAKLIEQNVLKLVGAGFTAEPVCRIGKPADEIMNLASKHRADLIVMGAQGLGAIARFLIGSVSTRVVQHANCAVLVVR